MKTAFTWEMIDTADGAIVKRFKSEAAAQKRLAAWNKAFPGGMSIRPVQSENAQAVRAAIMPKNPCRACNGVGGEQHDADCTERRWTGHVEKRFHVVTTLERVVLAAFESKDSAVSFQRCTDEQVCFRLTQLHSVAALGAPKTGSVLP